LLARMLANKLPIEIHLTLGTGLRWRLFGVKFSARNLSFHFD